MYIQRDVFLQTYRFLLRTGGLLCGYTSKSISIQSPLVTQPATSPTPDIPDDRMPPFFREIATRFRAGQSNVFLVSGNVLDHIDGLGVTCPADQPRHEARFGPLEVFLRRRLEARGRIVVSYNIARGLSFSGDAARGAVRDFFRQWDLTGPVDDPRTQESRAMRFDRALGESAVYSYMTLRFLEELCRLLRSRAGAAPMQLTILVQHAEMLLPDAPLAQMSDLDRQKLTLLREWFGDPAFQQSSEMVILVSTTEAGVNGDIRRLPHVTALSHPLPDVAARAAYLEWLQSRAASPVDLQPGIESLATMTAGLTLLALEGLHRLAGHRKGRLGEEDVLEALNRLLASELGDKIEVVRPSHTMADVIGASALKAELARLRDLLSRRDPSIAPVGILVAGPNGVGKTYIFEAWAAECGRLVVVLKNLRSMYFGQTDQIFEKLRIVLEALGNVIILIDEADTMFGRPGRDTHETEARLFGNLIRMMGDPRNRGRIVWLLLTARPERLAPDLKRSGRAGLHLPVFDPEGADRTAYIHHILRRAGIDAASLPSEQYAAIERATAELSPADFNEVLVELRAERALAGSLDFEAIRRVLDNILPGQIAAARRLQTLYAYLECSRKSLLPPSLRDADRAAIEREAERLAVSV